MSKPDESAFPPLDAARPAPQGPPLTPDVFPGDLTKRELLAAVAMHGLLSGHPNLGIHIHRIAFQLADAMLAEAQKQPDTPG